MKSIKRILTLVSVLIVTTMCAHAADKARVFKWKWSSMATPAVEDLYAAEKRFIEIIKKTSGGRLIIEHYPAGAIIPGYQTLDGVGSGAVDMGSDWPGYWAGKNPAFDYIGSLPFFFSPMDYFTWMYQYGGLELTQEIYGKFNVKFFLGSVTTGESGFRTSKKPIRSLKDYKGLRLRTSSRPTIWILKQLGCAAINLPASEVYTSLERGVVDGAEFSSPGLDLKMGFGEVTKYWNAPHWAQPASSIGYLVNKRSWDELPEDLKLIFETTAQANAIWSNTQQEKAAAAALRKFKAKGTILVHLPEKDVLELEKLGVQYTIKQIKENADFARVVKSQFAYLSDYYEWRKMQKPFGYGKNSAHLKEIMDALK